MYASVCVTVFNPSATQAVLVAASRMLTVGRVVHIPERRGEINLSGRAIGFR
jgi:hypothetical protein